ncbi:MAG: magnesium transporter [Candidatus Azotimanducaceae bacterium]|jgi:magnesium transporter
MMRAMLHDPATKTTLSGGVELLPQWRDSQQLLWLDLADEDNAAEMTFLMTEFNIHESVVYSAQRDRHPPKFEAFDNYYFLLLKGLSKDSTGINFETLQISMLVSERFFITRHNDESKSIGRLWDLCLREPDTFDKGLSSLPPRLGKLIVNRYLDMLFDIETNLDLIEQGLLNHDPSNDQLGLLTIYKTRLRVMSRLFNYHEQIFNQLRHNSEITQGQLLVHEFNDTYEQLERTSSLTRMYYDLSDDLINSSISMASHRLNGIMKVLTIITAIFVPLSFLAGLYGMNFEVMPELRFEYGYYALLGLMLFVATSLLVIFRIKRWL